MAVNEYGIDTNDIIFGGGAGYLPFFNDLLKDTTALQLGQGSLGQGLLNTLVQLRQNPASGPLGLAAFGTFGGTQGRAAGTGGKGLRDPYQGAFDRALSGLMSGIFGNPGSIFNPDNQGQVNTEATIFSNANEAPTMKPANAMSAPNSLVSSVMGTAAERPKKLAGGGTVSLGGVRDMLRGFIDEALDDDDFAERVEKTSKVTAAIRKLAEHESNGGASASVPGFRDGGKVQLPPPDVSERQRVAFTGEDPYRYDPYGGRELVEAARTSNDPLFAQKMMAIGRLKDALQTYFSADQAGGPVSTDASATIWKLLGQPTEMRDQNVTDPNSLWRRMTETYHAGGPDDIVSFIKELVQRYGLHGFATGGSMVFGGEPHFITDARGNAKAVITEDGQPEMVRGIRGGVEVVPMNPLRRALYERSKKFSRILAALDEDANALPGAQTGAKFMFPNVPGSKLNISPEGANQIPSMGGPGTTREEQVGPQFKSKYDPATGRFTLPGEATNATTADDIQGYAKLLGGALANTSTAFNPQSIRELGAGEVMRKLPSASALSTVHPTVRAGMMAFLSQALGMSPEDVQFEIDRFRPTALS